MSVHPSACCNVACRPVGVIWPEYNVANKFIIAIIKRVARTFWYWLEHIEAKYLKPKYINIQMKILDLGIQFHYNFCTILLWSITFLAYSCQGLSDTFTKYLPQHSATFHNIPKHSTILHNIPQYSTTFHNIPQHSTTFHIIPEHSTRCHTWWDLKLQYILYHIKKNCIRETKHLATDADSSTNTKKILRVRQNSSKKKKIVRWFYTLYEQTYSNLRPLLSISFPLGFFH